MKKEFLISIFSAALGFSTLAKSDDVDPIFTPTIVNAPVKTIYVPNGFDDNDNVEIVVHGHFKNSCYRVGSIFGVTDLENHTIQVQARALTYSASDCVAMAVPFTQSVKLGTLPAGTYTVTAATPGFNATEQLVISKAPTSSPDDYLYAPVEQVEIESVEGSTSQFHLTVKGTFPRLQNGCMVLKQVRAFTSPENVLVVLPISEVVFDARCNGSESPAARRFVQSQTIQVELKKDVLLHVRVLNGQSLNRVIEID